MLKIKFFSMFFFLTSVLMFAQESLNDYKYIIVPSQYEFQKSEDTYQLNSLTKFLFNKVGFIAILSTDNFPDDLAKNRCLALTAKLKKNSSMFSAKMNFDLVNCKSVVVFSSNEATSKEKEYKKAYHEVIRKTFESIKVKNYKYTPKEEIETIVIIPIEEVVKEKHITLQESKVETLGVEQTSDLLYAQPIQNGFQLLDGTSKRVYTIQYTSVKNMFILKDKNGILYKDNNDWIAEFYSNNQLIKKRLNIKF